MELIIFWRCWDTSGWWMLKIKEASSRCKGTRGIIRLHNFQDPTTSSLLRRRGTENSLWSSGDRAPGLKWQQVESSVTSCGLHLTLELHHNLMFGFQLSRLLFSFCLLGLSLMPSSAFFVSNVSYCLSWNFYFFLVRLSLFPSWFYVHSYMAMLAGKSGIKYQCTCQRL